MNLGTLLGSLVLTYLISSSTVNELVKWFRRATRSS
jgi:hypothetical protein